MLNISHVNLCQGEVDLELFNAVLEDLEANALKVQKHRKREVRTGEWEIVFVFLTVDENENTKKSFSSVFMFYSAILDLYISEPFFGSPCLNVNILRLKIFCGMVLAAAVFVKLLLAVV